jgi:hypothetical protein
MKRLYIRYPSQKKKNKHSLSLLMPLIFTSCCLHFKTPAVVSQHMWTPFSTLPLFSLGKNPGGAFRRAYRKGLPCLQENIQMGMQKMKFNDMLYPITLCDEISSCTISL